MGYDQIIEELKRRPANIKCGELKAMLVELGFVVRDCGRGNHKAFSHPRLPGFHGGNFDCGHKKQVKPVYVHSIRRTLELFEADLRAL